MKNTRTKKRRRLVASLAAGAATAIVALSLTGTTAFAQNDSPIIVAKPGEQVRLDWTWTNDIGKVTRLFHATDANNPTTEFELNAPEHTRFSENQTEPINGVIFQAKTSSASTWGPVHTRHLDRCEGKESGKKLVCKVLPYASGSGDTGATIEVGGALRIQPLLEVDADAPGGLFEADQHLAFPGRWQVPGGGEQRSATLSSSMKLWVNNPADRVVTNVVGPAGGVTPVSTFEPSVPTRGVLIVWPPSGTVLDSVRAKNNSNLTFTMQSDGRAVADQVATYGVGATSVEFAFKLPADAKPGTRYPWGAVEIAAPLSGQVIPPAVNDVYHAQVKLDIPTASGSALPGSATEEIALYPRTSENASVTGELVVTAPKGATIQNIRIEGSPSFNDFAYEDDRRKVTVKGSRSYGGTAGETAMVTLKLSETATPGQVLSGGAATIALDNTAGTVILGTVALEAQSLYPVRVTSPEPNAAVGMSGAEFTGTAEPGSTVRITDSTGEELDSAIANASGAWSKTLRLPEGPATLTFTAGASTDSWSGTVFDDSDELVVTSPRNRDTVDTQGVKFTGTGQPGEWLELRGTDGELLGSDRIGSDGTWSVTIDLAPGPATLTATAGTRTATVTVVAVPLVVTSPLNGETVGTTGVTVAGTGAAGTTVEIRGEDGEVLGSERVGKDLTWSVTIDLAPGPATLTATDGTRTATVTVVAVPLVVTSPLNGETVGTTGVTVAGTGAAGTTVEIRGEDGEVLGSERVGKDLTWSVTIDLAPGPATLTATDGTRTATVTVMAAEPFELVVTSPVKGEDGAAAVGTQDVVFTGTGRPGQGVEIRDADGTVLASGEIEADGGWSVTVPSFPEGPGTVTVVSGEQSILFDYVAITEEMGSPLVDPLIGGMVAVSALAGAGVFGLRRRLLAEV